MIVLTDCIDLITELRHKPTALGQIKDLTRFDYDFFGYQEKECELIGAQTRILHEVVYEALWDAGKHIFLLVHPPSNDLPNFIHDLELILVLESSIGLSNLTMKPLSI